jgi:hypothetical protein
MKVMMGATRAMAETLTGPKVLPTIRVSTKVLIFMAMDISRVGRKNSRNLARTS